MGADLCGVASIERFCNAPRGFNPKDIYEKTQSVIVFAKRVPSEALFAQSCIPYTHINMLIMQKVDTLGFEISNELEKKGIKSVIIPTDDPYEYWDDGNSTGRAILSLRHAGALAGLGKLGRNTLLTNSQYGNMIQIGAVLTNARFDEDPLAEYEVCPPGCQRCIVSCPAKALNGITVIQEKCRPLSNFKHKRGFVLKKCFECRKVCPSSFGLSNA
jgi:epoxyqueuosine reductase QueG